jgi:carboxyl-terminal processing protease
MNKSIKFQRLVLTFLVAVGFFSGGYYYGKRGFIFEVRKNPPSVKVTNKYPQNQEVDFALFWHVWDLVSENYLERPVDPQQMLYGALSGMVDSLGDPYTSFLPPSANESVTNSLNGAYEGIGAELGMREGALMVVAPVDGSPAKKAGLRSGDRILKIGDELTFGMTITEAVMLIRGEAGTSVFLTVQTDTQTARDVEIVRNKISAPSVSWEDKGDGTVYLRVSRFGEQTNADWVQAVNEISVQVEELDALIIDVRGNPGGYLQSAIFIAGEFFRNKIVVYQESALGELSPFNTKRMGSFGDVPAVFVLIDGGSASASEILAASLQHHVGAVLVGAQSFGKGTIQEPRDFKDGSGVHITVAKWLTPGKAWVHDVGIAPDVLIEVNPEDFEDDNDVQLDKAIELAGKY